jgi:hypothetical protein
MRLGPLTNGQAPCLGSPSDRLGLASIPPRRTPRGKGADRNPRLVATRPDVPKPFLVGAANRLNPYNAAHHHRHRIVPGDQLDTASGVGNIDTSGDYWRADMASCCKASARRKNGLSGGTAYDDVHAHLREVCSARLNAASNAAVALR